MEKTNLTHDQEMEVESHAPYLKVWMWLLVFTVVEYIYARQAKDAFLILVLGLMTCAIIKAAMVGWYFMHLKFEGKWVYAMLIPAGILAAVFTFALMPDVAMQPVTEESPEEEEATSMLLEPSPVPPVVRILT